MFIEKGLLRRAKARARRSWQRRTVTDIAVASGNGTQAYRTDIRAMSPEKGVNTYTIDNQEVDVVYTVFYRLPADRVA